ncbi:hypothetical protein Gotur_006938 [Gossypium turneri]
MVQCLLNEQPTHETFLAHIFQIWHPIQIPKLFPRMVELPEPDQKHIYRTIHFFLETIHFLDCFMELFL